MMALLWLCGFLPMHFPKNQITCSVFLDGMVHHTAYTGVYAYLDLSQMAFVYVYVFLLLLLLFRVLFFLSSFILFIFKFFFVVIPNSLSTFGRLVNYQLALFGRRFQCIHSLWHKPYVCCCVWLRRYCLISLCIFFFLGLCTFFIYNQY